MSALSQRRVSGEPRDEKSGRIFYQKEAARLRTLLKLQEAETSDLRRDLSWAYLMIELLTTKR